MHWNNKAPQKTLAASLNHTPKRYNAHERDTRNKINPPPDKQKYLLNVFQCFQNRD
jgi:hypothetical protein